MKVPQNTFLRTKFCPKTKKVTVSHRKLHNMKFHDVKYYTHIVLMVIKSRHVARTVIAIDLVQMAGSRTVILETWLLSRLVYVKFVVHTEAPRQIFS